jgi:hypothetical protein
MTATGASAEAPAPIARQIVALESPPQPGRVREAGGVARRAVTDPRS